MNENNYKFIVVTGSGKGIGSAIAKEWCRRNKINVYYGMSKWSGYDIRDEKLIINYINDIKIKHVKALVNNAGVVFPSTVIDTEYEDWKEQIDVNLNGSFLMSKYYAKKCIENNIPGKIINICSTAGLGPRPGRAAYAASKAALINFSLSLSEELKDYAIKVYCVCPEAVNTYMRRKINPDDNFNDMLQPKDIAIFVNDLIEDGNRLDSQILKIKL